MLSLSTAPTPPRSWWVMHRQGWHCFAEIHLLALLIYFLFMLKKPNCLLFSSVTLSLPYLIHHPILFRSYFLSATWCGGGSGQAGGQQDGVWPSGICTRPSAGLHHCQRSDPWGKTVQGEELYTTSKCSVTSGLQHSLFEQMFDPRLHFIFCTYSCGRWTNSNVHLHC